MTKHCAHPSCKAVVLKHELCCHHRPRIHTPRTRPIPEDQRIAQILKNRRRDACTGVPAGWL